MLSEHISWRGVIFGGHDHNRASIPPFLFERQDLVWYRQGAVNENAVCACLMISFGPTQGFRESPAADEGFDSGNDAKVRIGLGVFACLDLAAELLHVRHGLGVPLDKTIRLGEEFVFNA